MLSEKKAANSLKPWWVVAFQVTITALIILGTVSENEYGTPWLRAISFCPFEALPKEKMTQMVYHFKALI